MVSATFDDTIEPEMDVPARPTSAFPLQYPSHADAMNTVQLSTERESDGIMRPQLAGGWAHGGVTTLSTVLGLPLVFNAAVHGDRALSAEQVRTSQHALF